MTAAIRYRFILTLVGFMLASFPATAEEAPQEFEGMPLVFSDNFSGGSDRWVMTDPDAWKVQEAEGNKVLSLVGQSKYRAPVRSPYNIALVKDLDVGDFCMELTVKQTGREYGHRDACIFLGHQDATHFYYVHIATKADDHANSVFIVNNEPRTSIAKERTKGTDWGSEVHKIRVKRCAASGKIEVFFDDMEKPIMLAVDKTFVSGTVGVGSFDDTADFDNVRVWGNKAGEGSGSKESGSGSK